jgi:demethylmenaquinone methyltransferase/2-methoxy-6-polyprenyl-1,4-benzoquinol methylase
MIARMPDGVAVKAMFARVARRYDLVNSVLSLGVHHLWRRAAVRFAEVRSGETALDVCAGTGDLSLTLARAGARVVGSDFCREMLALAGRKRGAARVRFACADTLALPFADGSFDVTAVAFGIRNVGDPLSGLREMRRVTRPGGRVAVLEFCRPRGRLFARAYLFYFRRILPCVGRWVAGDRDGAYAYLRDSVLSFPERGEFLQMMADAGLRSPRLRLLSGGIAAVYRAEVPA